MLMANAGHGRNLRKAIDPALTVIAANVRALIPGPMLRLSDKATVQSRKTIPRASRTSKATEVIG